MNETDASGDTVISGGDSRTQAREVLRATVLVLAVEPGDADLQLVDTPGSGDATDAWCSVRCSGPYDLLALVDRPHEFARLTLED